jgi:replication factor C subunit 3/5
MTVSCQEYFPALHSRLLSTMQVYALTCCAEISEMKTRKGLALFDVVRELQPFVFSIDMPPAVRIQLIDALADIEYRLAFGPNEKLQLGALLSAFTHARTTLVAAAQ